MSKKKKIIYQDKTFRIEPEDTVLNCLIKNKVDVSYSCKNGFCHMCIMQAKNGKLPSQSQKGLPRIYKKQNLFLSCQCRPHQNMEIDKYDEANLGVVAIILDKDFIGKNIVRLKLELLEPFRCEPGKYIALINSRGIKRHYSVANDPMLKGMIELHIKIVPNGLMSSWLMEDARLGEEVIICGPYGECFYRTDKSTNDSIILIGSGTGLAPLYGILKDSLNKNHKGKIRLYQSAVSYGSLYFKEEIFEIQNKHKNFYYAPCLSSKADNYNSINKDIKKDLLLDLNNKSDLRVFICGSSSFLNSVKKSISSCGVKSNQIFSDAFVYNA